MNNIVITFEADMSNYSKRMQIKTDRSYMAIAISMNELGPLVTNTEYRHAYAKRIAHSKYNTLGLNERDIPRFIHLIERAVMSPCDGRTEIYFRDGAIPKDAHHKALDERPKAVFDIKLDELKCVYEKRLFERLDDLKFKRRLDFQVIGNPQKQRSEEDMILGDLSGRCLT